MSRASHLFAELFSFHANVSKAHAAAIHDDMTGELNRRGIDFQTDSPDTADAVHQRTVSMLSRVALIDMGKKILIAILGVLVVPALPEAFLIAAAVLIIGLIIKAQFATFHEFRSATQDNLNTISSGIDKITSGEN